MIQYIPTVPVRPVLCVLPANLLSGYLLPIPPQSVSDLSLSHSPRGSRIDLAPGIAVALCQVDDVEESVPISLCKLHQKPVFMLLWSLLQYYPEY